jgi:hypothetical protein
MREEEDTMKRRQRRRWRTWWPASPYSTLPLIGIKYYIIIIIIITVDIRDKTLSTIECTVQKGRNLNLSK